MTLIVDHHARFEELMLDGGNGGVPRDLAVHALTCRDCARLASSLAILGTLDLDGAALPALAPAPARAAAPARVPTAVAPVAPSAAPSASRGAPTPVGHAPAGEPALAALAALDLSLAPLVGTEPAAAPAAAPLRQREAPLAADAAALPGLGALASVDVGAAPLPAAAPSPAPRAPRAEAPPRRRAPALAWVATAAAFLFVAGGVAAGAVVLRGQDGDQVGGILPTATPTPGQDVLGGAGTPEPTPEETDVSRRVGTASETKQPRESDTPSPEPTERVDEPAEGPPPPAATPTPTPFFAAEPPPPATQAPPPPPGATPTPAPQPTPTPAPTAQPTSTPQPTPTPPTIGFAGDRAVDEPVSGSTSMTFTVLLSAPSSNTVTVSYATQDDTARAGSDYVAKSGTLTFNPGEQSKTITVTVMSDGLSVDVVDERFFVNLSGVSNAIMGDDQAVGTIRTQTPA